MYLLKDDMVISMLFYGRSFCLDISVDSLWSAGYLDKFHTTEEDCNDCGDDDGFGISGGISNVSDDKYKNV